MLDKGMIHLTELQGIKEYLQIEQIHRHHELMGRAWESDGLGVNPDSVNHWLSGTQLTSLSLSFLIHTMAKIILPIS